MKVRIERQEIVTRVYEVEATSTQDAFDRIDEWTLTSETRVRNADETAEVEVVDPTLLPSEVRAPEQEPMW